MPKIKVKYNLRLLTDVSNKIVLTKKNNECIPSEESFAGCCNGVRNLELFFTFDAKGRQNGTSTNIGKRTDSEVAVTVSSPGPVSMVHPSQEYSTGSLSTGRSLPQGDRRGGIKGAINLIPELCQVTGQSDEIRSNFRLQENERRMTSIATKVYIQMQCKIGSEAWVSPYHLKSCHQKYFSIEMEVGEGNIYQVKEDELKKVLNVFKNFTTAQDQIPLLTYIIVCKRISTKFFSIGKRQNDYGNPPPGTIIDDVVTHPEKHDFYLICQSVRQGTVNPTSYNVIHNGSKWKPDHIQRLTYKLTHLYYNWAGTIKVPAPVQYAHKAAQLIGEHLHTEDIADILKDELWYL
ncbi:AUB [Lepeophtheirus salmonis]|uniref:AUB n=1 Tax=Lepeophtheirus salmonis TaxID=72036 RepID=A0A7R8CD35_LEPSM|nr:AUB [Lepeophtheirus salmonis]CAF2777120.1 AUB [Lepeophtheirus salmonis]